MVLIVSVVMPVNTPVSTQAAKKLKLNKTKVSIYVGKRTKLTAKNTGDKKIVWSTSNKAIAKVSQKGSVLAVKAGTATIKATIKGTKQSASCKVTVGKYATKLNVESAENVILKEGEKTEIKASVSPAKVLYKQLTYKSANEKIATVNEAGEITAVKQGLTEIIVKTKATNKKGKKLTKVISVYVEPVFDEEVEDTDKEQGTENSTTNGNTGNINGGTSTGGNLNDSSNNTTPQAEPVLNTIKNGTTETYVLDKNYSDQITAKITVNGKEWKEVGTVESVIEDLETTWATKTSSDKTMEVKRPNDEEWWIVTDLTTGNVLFRVKASSSYEGNSDLGQIVVEKVSGNVNVQIR